MNQKDIGKFISIKRKEKNLTQEQLAEKLNVSNKTVSKWENGKCLPDYSIVELLCKELDITIIELFEGEKSAGEGTVDEEKYNAVLYRLQQSENKIKELEHRIYHSVTTTGIGFGSALAMIISYVNWHSIGWAILHGCFGWGYVIYFLIKYL